MNKYNIGLEIHIRINCGYKLFSPAINSFSNIPNSNVDVRDMGFPGITPLINKRVIAKAILLAKLFNCNIEHIILFDRKNYFYSDLPKGFQITQKRKPFGKNGNIIVNDKLIRIREIHIEEDTCKQSHHENFTSLDYNRCGVPLIEIVFEPDIHNSSDVILALKNIIDLAKRYDISDCKLQDGSLRADINVSSKVGCSSTYIEMKNLNSFKDIQKAFVFLDSNTNLLNENATYRFDEKSSSLIKMRNKNNNYRYSPEINIPPILLSDDYIDGINVLESFVATSQEAKFFTNLSSLFDKDVANHWINNVLPSFLNKKDFERLDFNELVEIIKMVYEGKIETSQAKMIIKKSIYENVSLGHILMETKSSGINDDVVIKIIDKTLDLNRDLIREYINGKSHVINYLMSVILKELHEYYNPSLLKELIEKEIKATCQS